MKRTKESQASAALEFRDFFLRTIVAAGGALVVVTETLSVFGLLRRGPLAVCWIAFCVAALVWVRCRHVRMGRISGSRDPVVILCGGGIAAVLALTAVTAAFSPPNSADAMAYHMPRVVYWAEQSSVRFFPTAYFNQVMLQPLAEYAMLHTYLLTGGDRLVNFVQWFGSLGSIVGVSALAGLFGYGARGQAIAALFCATLPSGILASSGAKNDYWLAMWLVAAMYFALRFTRTLRIADAAFLGGALGLALLTKATAYLFVPWPLAAILLPDARGMRKRLAGGAVVAIVFALAMNSPQYARNFGLSGSVMGFDSAQGNGFFRWRNETFGWRQTASNVLRNTSEQLGARSPDWNKAVYEWVLAAHRRLGIDANDPDTTWRWSSFAPPQNSNHEANAPNRWQLALLAGIFCALGIRAVRKRRWMQFGYAVALIFGFLSFCAYLKWQPFMARLFLPLFVLASPLAGIFEEAGGRGVPQTVLCLFLLSNARLPLFQNWVRPLKGPANILRTPRGDQYFADLGQWHNRETYRKSVELLARSNCDTIGIDITNLQLEYPIQALLRERRPGVRFAHAGVGNVSSRYRQPVAASPCAVVCLDCAGDPKRLGLYTGYTRAVSVDRFVLFFRR